MPTNQDLQLAAHLRSQVTTLTRRLRREAQADPVQFSQLVVLGAIDRLGGDVTPSELAAAERMRSSNLAALLRELERGGADRPSRRSARWAQNPRVAELGGPAKSLRQPRQARRMAGACHARLSRRERERALLAAAGPLLTRLAQFEEP